MLRMIGRLSAIAAGLLLFIPLHYAWRLVRASSPWPPRFLGFAARRCGLRPRIVGTPRRGGTLLAANHESWLDILALGGTSGAAFVAKDEVRQWPFFGWLAGMNDTLYVVRAARHQVRGQADQIRDALASGRDVALFPEGTIDETRDVLPFRASLFASLYPPVAGVAVQPIAIDYGDAVADIAWLDGEGTVANARRILSRRGVIPVTLTFLAPIDPAAWNDRKALAAAARAQVVAALAASAPGPHPL